MSGTANNGGRPRQSAAAIIRSGAWQERARGVARFVLSPERWAELSDRLAEDVLPLHGLWADGTHVHALFLEGSDSPLIASVPVEAQRYLALSPVRPAAARCERMVRDLWGVEAMAARDLRPWLDHGAWDRSAPLSARPGPPGWPPEPPEFLGGEADEAAGRYQLGIGPVQGLVGGPAHLRLSLEGERIARLETRLGYGHRGIQALMRGRSPLDAAPFAARLEAESTVAHQTAYARAVEAAVGLSVGEDTEALRMAMGEIERAATHLLCLARLARCTGLPRAARLAVELREMLLGRCGLVFGHRLLLDRVVPGGVILAGQDTGAFDEAAKAVLAKLARLERMFVREAGAVRRLAGQATLPAAVAARHLLGGVAGRASGRGDELAALLPRWRGQALRLHRGTGGDALERARLRFAEVADTLAFSRGILGSGLQVEPPRPVPAGNEGRGRDGDGLALAESPHGPVWHWVVLADGLVAATHVQDPALAAWSALEEAAVGRERQDLPLLCASLGLAFGGADG